MGLAVLLDPWIRQRRGPYGGPCDACGGEGDPCISAAALQHQPGARAALRFNAQIPGAEAPHGLTGNHDHLKDRDQGIRLHRLAAVVMQVSVI